VIDRSFSHLHVLQTAAVTALRDARSTIPLAFPADARELHRVACDARVSLLDALQIASGAGCFEAMRAKIEPAVAALTVLISACREEIETRRAS
jgi:hypothetical protein